MPPIPFTCSITPCQQGICAMADSTRTLFTAVFIGRGRPKAFDEVKVTCGGRQAPSQRAACQTVTSNPTARHHQPIGHNRP